MNKHFLLASVILLLPQLTVAQGLEWIQRIGGAGTDEGLSVATDRDHNVYTAGFFEATVDFDPGPGVYNMTAGGKNDIFLLKLDASGHFIWAKQISGNGEVYYTLSVLIDEPRGSVYVSGNFKETADFDSSPDASVNLSSAGSWDGFLLKLDTAGNFAWVKQMGGPGADHAFGMSVDQDGNIYTAGRFNDTVDFDPGIGVFNLIASDFGSDIFVQKSDSSGKLIWAKSMGGSQYDYGWSIAVDANGNVYTTGAFDGTVDFDPGPGVFNLSETNPDVSVFIQKLDASGNFVWAKQIEGSEYRRVGRTVVDSKGHIYTTGWFRGGIDLDPGPGKAIFESNFSTSPDIFIQKLDDSGNYIWGKQMGGTSWDQGMSIVVDSAGTVYTTGYFNNTADFDAGPAALNFTAAGWDDIFIQKLDAAGDFIWAGTMGGLSSDQGLSMAVGPKGQIYTTGYFARTADMDPEISGTYLTTAGLGDIFIQKLDQAWNFHGTVFNDLNSNQIQDPGEPGIGGVILKTDGRDLFATTDSAGHYRIYSNIVGDSLRVINTRPYFWSVSPAAALPDSAQQVMDFAVAIQPGARDVGISVVQTTPFRPGFEGELCIHLTNYGLVALDSVFVALDALVAGPDTDLLFLSSDPPPTVVSGDSLAWQVDGLQPFEPFVICVRFKTPTALTNGDLLNISSWITLAGDAYIANNSTRATITVVGSYDPNDKWVSLPAIVPAELDSARLNYVIRFQNTGTYPAEFVVIQDTLPEELDAASLQMIGASHPFTWSLRKERLLEVRFDPIFLPDSLSDEPGSHGFVAFSVRPRGNLSVDDSVSNRAGIYFDYNPPVITNSAVTKVTLLSKTLEPLAKTWLEFGLSPNPVSRHAAVTVDLPLQGMQEAKIVILNAKGQLARQLSVPAGKQRVQLDGLPAGAYWVQVRVGALYGGKLLVVE